MTISIMMSRFLEYKFSFKFKLDSIPVFYGALITLTSFNPKNANNAKAFVTEKATFWPAGAAAKMII